MSIKNNISLVLSNGTSGILGLLKKKRKKKAGWVFITYSNKISCSVYNNLKICSSNPSKILKLDHILDIYYLIWLQFLYGVSSEPESDPKFW